MVETEVLWIDLWYQSFHVVQSQCLITEREINNVLLSLFFFSEQPPQNTLKHTWNESSFAHSVYPELECSGNTGWTPACNTFSYPNLIPTFWSSLSSERGVGFQQPPYITALPNIWCVYSSGPQAISLSNDWQQLWNEVGPKWALIVMGSLSSQT